MTSANVLYHQTGKIAKWRLREQHVTSCYCPQPILFTRFKFLQLLPLFQKKVQVKSLLCSHNRRNPAQDKCTPASGQVVCVTTMKVPAFKLK